MSAKELMKAVKENDLNAVQACMDGTSKLFAYHRNALKEALDKKSWEIANLLMDSGVSAAGLNDNKYLPDAAVAGQIQTVIKLIDAGANINAYNRYGYTALLAASNNGGADTVAALIKKGAALENKYFTGETALLLAVQNWHLECAKLLLAAGADIHATARRNNNALSMAVSNNDEAMVRLLVQHGVDIDKPCDSEGVIGQQENTALMKAARVAANKMVRTLLDLGANPYTKNKAGKTAIDLANEGGHADTASLIESFAEQKALSQSFADFESPESKGMAF